MGGSQVPAYGEIQTGADLIRYSKAYLALTIAHYDMDIDASHIADWQVTHQAKRTAAKVEHLDLRKLARGLFMAGFSKPDWDTLREEHNDTVTRRTDFSDVRDVRVVLSWDAYEAFDREEWLATIRHEAIHIEQYMTYGRADHGMTFSDRARELQTTEHCKKFEDFKYPFKCEACGQDAGGRYRESKAVKFARAVTRGREDEWSDTEWTTDCCNAYISLKS